MDEQTLQAMAGQLRQPNGENALLVGEKMNEGNRLINMHTNESLTLETGAHILEIGMGNGFFVKDILQANPSVRYTGCDLSEMMVNEAKKRIP